MTKVLFISSSGGHLNELLQLSALFSKYDSYFITEKTKSTINLTKDYPNKVFYLLFSTRFQLNYLYIFPINIIKSFIYFLKIKPDYIISTGSHTAVPMCYIAWLFRKKIIYIETFANINTKSLAGKLVYPISDIFIVQWESMLKLYPKAIYGGWIY